MTTATNENCLLCHTPASIGVKFIPPKTHELGIVWDIADGNEPYFMFFLCPDCFSKSDSLKKAEVLIVEKARRCGVLPSNNSQLS